MSDRERQCGVLPYSLVPGAGGTLDMALLVFRDPAGSNSLQSGRFFSELVCARDAVRPSLSKKHFLYHHDLLALTGNTRSTFTVEMTPAGQGRSHPDGRRGARL
jgi:hypothetical protein